MSGRRRTRGRLRLAVGKAASAVAARANRSFVIQLDHPPAADRSPRWGHGKPPHARLTAILGEHHERFAQELTGLVRWTDELLAVPTLDDDGPAWDQAWLPAADAASVYGFLRGRRPRTYLEVGSGTSTRFAALARERGGGATRIVSIDPAPRASIDALCDVVLRSPLESLDPKAVAAMVEPGDVVFVDCSHRALPGSDVIAFFLDILWELPAGVLVGIHDVLLPEDYHPAWTDLWFSEQYLLGVLLLGRSPAIEPVLATRYALGQPDLRSILDPLLDPLAHRGVPGLGWGFWFELCAVDDAS